MGLSDARQEDEFLEFGCGILFVNGHAIEEAINGDCGSGCSACLCLGAEHEGMGEGGWEAVRLCATTESSDADLTESGFFSATSGDFGFEDHANGDALAVEEVWREEGFDGMADSVTKIDEVAQVGFLWIVRDDGGLCVDRGDDECEKGVGFEIVEGLGVNVGEGVEEGCRGGFEEGKRVFVPDGSSLRDDEGGAAIRGEIRTLMISARPFASSRFGRDARKATSIKMNSGCQNAPMRFFPRGVSMAVFPPMAESTMARREVGI